MNLVFFVKILNFINLLSKSNAVNVALKKKTVFCEIHELPASVTNGDLNDQLTAIVNQECKTSYSFVDVYLEEKYHVDRVIVKTGGKQFDYYFVKLLVKKAFVLCGEYPVTSVGYDQIVCRKQPPTDKVRLETRVDDGMILYEIEVHSEGDDGNEEIFYEGCFTIFRGVQQADSNVHQCRRICVNTHKYFGIRESKYCFCGNEYSPIHEIPAFKCGLCSPTAKFRCGSKDAFSVYKSENRKSYFAGCHRLKMEEEFVIRPSIFTCMDHCESSEYMVVTMGHKCSCLKSTMTFDGSSSFDCKIRCPLDVSINCGGKETYTFYKTCYYGPNSFPCTQLYHCNIFKPDGSCEQCDPYYMGFGCVHRVYDKEGCWSPNVCQDQPNTKCKDVENSYDCQCITNYVRLEENGTCTRRMYTKCKVLNGTYSCYCIKGYEKNELDRCVAMAWTIFGIDPSYVLYASLLTVLLLVMLCSAIVAIMSRKEQYFSSEE